MRVCVKNENKTVYREPIGLHLFGLIEPILLLSMFIIIIFLISVTNLHLMY